MMEIVFIASTHGLSVRPNTDTKNSIIFFNFPPMFPGQGSLLSLALLYLWVEFHLDRRPCSVGQLYIS